MDNRLFLWKDWLRVTDGISQEARHLLYVLIRAAALSNRTEIPVDVGAIAAQFANAEERDACPERFAELGRSGLVREVRPGLYAIAEGLWRIGPDGADLGSYFPAPD